MANGEKSIIHDYGFLADANTNLSLPTKWSYGDLVTHPVYGDCVVDKEVIRTLDPRGVVIYVSNGTTHASGFTYDTILNIHKNKKATVPSDEIKKFSWRKFLLWRHPSGGWMHGKNGAIGAAIRYAAFLGFSFYGVTQLKMSSYWLFMVFIPLVIIGLMLRGTRQNFDGKHF